MGTPVTTEINPDIDSASYIFDVLFECRVKNIDLYSEGELRNFGSFSTGMDIFDSDNMTQMVSANLSISQMSVHVSKGYNLRFVYAQDVLKVYEFTQHHLQRWAERVANASLNGAGAPLDDLIKLDLFCTKVYDQAKYYDHAKLTSLEQRFGRAQGFDAIKNMISNNGVAQTVEKLENLNTVHRKGFSQLFEELHMRKTNALQGVKMRDLNG